jgi:hypothetical protein
MIYNHLFNSFSATQVEWFHGCEWFRHWCEEVQLLKRETGSVLLDFCAGKQAWLTRAQSDFARISTGYQAYCFRQSSAWKALYNDRFTRCNDILKVCGTYDCYPGLPSSLQQQSMPQPSLCRQVLHLHEHQEAGGL